MVSKESLKELFSKHDFSERTKQDIETAYNHGNDSIGEFFYNPDEKTVLELIQFAQSTANPETLGYLRTKSEWEKVSGNWHGNVLGGIEPYSANGEYTSYALAPSSNKEFYSKMIVPLRINFSGKERVGLPGQNIDRIGKIWGFFNDLFGIKVSVSETYGQTTYKISRNPLKKSDSLQINLNINSNDFEAFAIACNVAAQKLLKDANLTNEERIVAIKLATIGLSRSFDLGDAKFAYQIDEALKLDFFTALGLLNGQRRDCVSKISSAAKEAIDSLFGKSFDDQALKEFKLRTIENLKNMGFEVEYEGSALPEQSEIVLGCANNLKKIFALSPVYASEAPAREAASMEAPSESGSALPRARAALAAAAASGGRIRLETILKKIESYAPGILRDKLFVGGQKEKRDTEQSIPVYAVGLNPKQYMGEVNPRSRRKLLGSESFQKYLNNSYEAAVYSAVGKVKDFATKEYKSGTLKTRKVENLILGAYRDGMNEEDAMKVRLGNISKDVLKQATSDAIAKNNEGQQQ